MFSAFSSTSKCNYIIYDLLHESATESVVDAIAVESCAMETLENSQTTNA